MLKEDEELFDQITMAVLNLTVEGSPFERVGYDFDTWADATDSLRIKTRGASDFIIYIRKPYESMNGAKFETELVNFVPVAYYEGGRATMFRRGGWVAFLLKFGKERGRAGAAPKDKAKDGENAFEPVDDSHLFAPDGTPQKVS